MSQSKTVGIGAYAERAIGHLQGLLASNQAALEQAAAELLSAVKAGNRLLACGSGHSSIFALELYHRAGGASFVIPVVADYLLPTAGPPVVRALERTSGVLQPLFERTAARAGDVLWIASQSGINTAAIDLALMAKARGLRTVAFTSRVHSSAVSSRHPLGHKLMDVCDTVIDLGGEVGDAAIPVGPDLKAGPLSSLGAILLAHSILVKTCADLEASGHPCVYTSVNTEGGEIRNRELEREAALRDFLLRG